MHCMAVEHALIKRPLLPLASTCRVSRAGGDKPVDTAQQLGEPAEMLQRSEPRKAAGWKLGYQLTGSKDAYIKDRIRA